MEARCSGKGLFYSEVLQQVNERMGHILRSTITMEHELRLWLSIPALQKAINVLHDDVSGNYWMPTEGNAKRALTQLLAMARMRPDGVWEGD